MLGQFETLGIFIVIGVIIFVLKDVLSSLTFGVFNVKTNNGLLGDIVADIATKDKLAAEVDQLDSICKKQERATMNRAIRDMLAEKATNAETLFRARFPLSVATCDNHITRLVSENSDGYFATKVEEALDSVPNHTDQDRQAVIRLVSLWYEGVIQANKSMINAKLKVYERYYDTLKVDANKQICKQKIEKNESYLHSLQQSNVSSDSVSREYIG